MSVEYNGQEVSKREAVRMILAESDIGLEQPARQYADRILSQQPDPLEIDHLIAYLASNIAVVDAESRLLLRQLDAVIEGQDPVSVRDETPTKDQITEKELEDIMFGFEYFVEDKLRREDIVTMDDVTQYARQTGYPIQVVLFAMDLCESSLSDEVIDRQAEAEEAISWV